MKTKILSALFLITTFFTTKAQDKLYPNFPESFESDSKLRYDLDDVNLPTGRWRLDNVVIQKERHEMPITGTHAVRMAMNHSKSAYLQMMFDLPNGASKISFWYKIFSTDKPCMFQLEYSSNKGKKWMPIGDLIVATDGTKYTKAEFDLDLDGPVRFRINKIGLGDGSKNPDISNGRLNLEDFAVYHK